MAMIRTTGPTTKGPYPSSPHAIAYPPSRLHFTPRRPPSAQPHPFPPLPRPASAKEEYRRARLEDPDFPCPAAPPPQENARPRRPLVVPPPFGALPPGLESACAGPALDPDPEGDSESDGHGGEGRVPARLQALALEMAEARNREKPALPPATAAGAAGAKEEGPAEQFNRGVRHARVAAAAEAAGRAGEAGREMRRAARWFRRAARANHARAAFNLAQCTMSGRGARRDPAAAAALLRCAAERGHGPALLHLGRSGPLRPGPNSSGPAQIESARPG